MRLWRAATLKLCGCLCVCQPTFFSVISGFAAEFKNYYGPTMNAFAAAETAGRAADLQKELEELFERQNQSADKTQTSIQATFLRVTISV